MENISKEMKGTKEVRDLIKIFIWLLVFECFILFLGMGVFLFRDSKIFQLQFNFNSLFIILVLLIWLIYVTNKKIGEMCNELLDYLDMEELKSMKDAPYKSYSENGIELQDFRQEVWNNINRRGEKAKLGLLQKVDSNVEIVLDLIKKLLQK